MLFINFFATLLSSHLTAYLINKKSLCPIQTSAAVTILMVVLSKSIFETPTQLELFIFGGSFIGMSLYQKFHLLEITFASLLFSLNIITLSHFLPKIGGILGFGAFLSLFCAQITHNLYKIIIKKGRKQL